MSKSMMCVWCEFCLKKCISVFQIEDIRNSIDKIDENVAEVKKLYSVILSAPTSDQKTQDELESLTNDIKKMANNARNKLKTIERNLESDEEERVSADMRIRKSQHAVLSRKFVDVMTKYNEAQMDFREKSKGRIQRQLEISNVINTKKTYNLYIYYKNIYIFYISFMYYSALWCTVVCPSHVSVCPADMVCVYVFQGDIINNIEVNVSKAVDHVEVAKAETKKAVRYQKYHCWHCSRLALLAISVDNDALCCTSKHHENMSTDAEIIF
uniref:Syntaxin 3A n=1 Tax=Astyanax mexicanus TaxID=7994 RepID=A0A8B9K0P9_ASTMX